MVLSVFGLVGLVVVGGEGWRMEEGGWEERGEEE